MVLKSGTDNDFACTIDDVAKALLATHDVWARKYVTTTEKGYEDLERYQAFFIIAVPKGFVLSPSLVSNIGGSVAASLVEANRGR